MHVYASLDPDVAPITPEMVAALPVPPRDRHRSQVCYRSDEFDPQDHRADDVVRRFLAGLAALRPQFEEAFGTTFRTFLYLRGGRGSVFIDNFMLADLAALKATFEWTSDGGPV